MLFFSNYDFTITSDAMKIKVNTVLYHYSVTSKQVGYFRGLLRISELYGVQLKFVQTYNYKRCCFFQTTVFTYFDFHSIRRYLVKLGNAGKFEFNFN